MSRNPACPSSEHSGSTVRWCMVTSSWRPAPATKSSLSAAEVVPSAVPRVASHEAVSPTRMTAVERSALADALFEAVGEVFDTDNETAKRLMIEPNSQLTHILLAKSEEGRVVGLCAVHFFERQFRGAPVTILRVQSGMLHAYRGRSIDIPWFLRVVLKYTLTNPRRTLYFLGLVIHPSSYLLIARLGSAYWPKPNVPVPPEMLAFMIELADEFGMQVVDPGQPLLRRSTLRTRETEAERSYWRQCDKPAARFFVSMNPDYGERHGLLFLSRVSVPLIVSAAGRFALGKAERSLEGALATTLRVPLAARLIGASAVRKHLRSTDLFAGLADADLEALVAVAELVSLPASTYLFHEGDEGEDLYVITRGAACVVTTASDGETMIDQLGAGVLLGEVAMLSGGRRSASIRTAIASTLVRIRGVALRALMVENAGFGATVWGVFAARIFDDHLRVSGATQGLDRAGRTAWIRRGRHEELGPDASVDVEGDVFVLVLSGVVLIDRGGEAMSAQAPIVVELDASTRIRANTAARVVHVPPL